MYTIEFTGQFKKSVKRCKKRGLDLEELHKVIRLLAEKGTLPQEYKPHILSGKYAGIWECHVKPDWLLLWKQYDSKFILMFLDTGSHSDIFG